LSESWHIDQRVMALRLHTSSSIYKIDISVFKMAAMLCFWVISSLQSNTNLCNHILDHYFKVNIWL